MNSKGFIELSKKRMFKSYHIKHRTQYSWKIISKIVLAFQAGNIQIKISLINSCLFLLSIYVLRNLILNVP